MLAFFVLDPPLDGAAKLVEAAGKNNLAFASLLVLVLASLAVKFFGKDAQWLRIGAFLVIIACIVFFIFVLAIPFPKKETKQGPSGVRPPTTVPAAATPKECNGEHTDLFTPQTPGVLQTDSAGHYIDLGDGGGGTRLYKWAHSWTAPAAITSVACTGGRNENVLAQNANGSTAECEGSVNGGNDAIKMHVVWNGPCDQQ